VNKRYGEISTEDIKIIEQSDLVSVGGDYWKDIDIDGVIISRKASLIRLLEQ
jgi:hypothetical protein